MTVSESVKNRTDRKTTDHLRPEFFASSPAPRPATVSASARPVPKKKTNIKKQQPKRVSTSTRKKTVTRRTKASDRSLGGPTAGSLLQRKVLAAVLLHRNSGQTDTKIKGKARKVQPSGRATHPAISKYVLETAEYEAGASSSDVKAKVAEARKKLVEQGVLVSSKKGVLFTAAAEDAIDGLYDDEDVDDVAAECLAHFYKDEVGDPNVEGDDADTTPSALRKRSARRAVDHEEPNESAGDEDDENGIAEDIPNPKAKSTTTKQRKVVVEARATAAPPNKRRISTPEPLAKLKKADLISRVKSLEQALSAAQQLGDGSITDGEDEDDAEELRHKLLAISLANQQWRKKALELRDRLTEHVDPATINFDERDAYGAMVLDSAGQEDDGRADLGGLDQQMFDNFVDPEAAAPGPSKRSGFDDQEFPELVFDDQPGKSPPGPNVTPDAKGKGKQIEHRTQSPFGPVSSSSAWLASSTSGPVTSSPWTSPLQKSGQPTSSVGASAPFGGTTRADGASPSAVASEKARANSYKEELELMQRAHHEKVAELTNAAHELGARLAASERRLVAYQAAAAASVLMDGVDLPCEHEERLREHHTALADALKRHEALERELVTKTAALEQQRLELASSAADYEGLLAREGRLKQELHSSNRRVTELATQLVDALKQLEAHKADTTATLESAAERNKELEQELNAVRTGAAKLKASLAHFEAELEKSSKELGAATTECRELQTRLETSQREKERETEALDLSMEQRRILELELARLKEELAVAKQRLDTALSQHLSRTQADQETITTLTQERSALLIKLESLEALEPTAEQAEQYRADMAALESELRDSETRYKQVQNARHAEESLLRARDSQIFDLVHSNERLHLELLDSEAQAERAKSRVDELEVLHAKLTSEAADSETTLDHLLEQLRSALQLPDSVPVASPSSDAAAVVSAVQRLHKERADLRAAVAHHLGLLNFARSNARDILALLPTPFPVPNDAALDVLLVAILKGICKSCDSTFGVQQQLEQARAQLASMAEVLGRLVATLSASVGLDPVATSEDTDTVSILALEEQISQLAAAVATKVDFLVGANSESCRLVERERQLVSASFEQVEKQKSEITTLQIQLSKTRSLRDQLEQRLASIRQLSETVDLSSDS